MPFNYILKKCPLILLVLICTGVGADGQDVLFAFKGGLNFTSFRGNNPGGELSSRTAFNVGDIVEVQLARNFSLQAETQYSSQGASLTNGGNPVEVKLNYFIVPILLKYIHRSGLFLESGPQFGFLLAAHDEVDGVSTNVSSIFQSYDFAWVFGAGCYLTSRLGIDVRYNEGLINITEAAILAGDRLVKSSVIQTDIFIELGNGKKIRSKF
jgi:hypothetical protein